MGEKKTISTICNVLNGFAFKSDKYVSSGTRVIRITNVQKGYVVDDDPKYYPESAMSQLGQYVLRENDLLMSLTGNVGRVGLLTKDLLPAALNQRVACLRIKDSGVLLKYLFYYLNSDLFEKAAFFSASGIAQKNMSTEWLKKVEIPVPSIGEQQRIVDELDLLTGIIDKKNAQLRDLDALAQSIFYEMFGDPITNDKGWECCALKDVATIVGGSTPKTNIKEYWGGSNYWVTPAELHGERYYGATERTISDLAVKSTNLTLLPIGTVLLSSRAPIGKVAITTVPMYCNQGFKNVICSDRINNEYICQALRGKTEYLQALGTGATFKEISKKTTENIKIAIPPLALQKKFAAKVQMIEQQKKVVAKSLVDAQALFDSKMSHYFV